MGKKVAIIWRFLPDYRLPFYLGLKEYLAQRDVELKVIYGPMNGMGPVDRQQTAPWGECVRDWRISVGRIELCWQPYISYIRDADLVVVEQANRLLLNYWLMAGRLFRNQKIAFWGHGRDLQATSNSLRNRWKRVFLKNVDWWFAYTAEVKEAIVKSAFPAMRITNVQNASDTDSLRLAKSAATIAQLENLRSELGLGAGPVGIYCGRIYRDKRIGFLLKACAGIKKRIPNFEVIIIGSGPQEEEIVAAARKERWIHYVGPKFGNARVPYFLLSDVSLMPGAVGLAIIDCFALEVPLMTTKFPYHGPEIAYLKNGENGLITDDDLESYVAGVVDALMNQTAIEKMKKGCREAANIYTVRNMVEKFGSGVIACLQS